MATLPGSMLPAIMSACRSLRVVAVRVSVDGLFTSVRTLSLTFSHLSPSMMSSAPLPQIWSLPEPPMMMFPAPKLVVPGGRRSLRPLIRAIPAASRTLLAPGTPTSVSGSDGTTSSPRRMSSLSQPESASTRRNRSLSALGPSTMTMRMSESPGSTDRAWVTQSKP